MNYLTFGSLNVALGIAMLALVGNRFRTGG